MPALLDDQGNYVYPEGFDSEAGERLEGYEQERDEWEEQYAAARSRFDAHRRLFGISGYDVTITIPVTFTELILGAKIRIGHCDAPGRSLSSSRLARQMGGHCE